MATATDQQAPPTPGAFFDVPGAPGGESQWLDEYETTQALNVVLSSANQIQVNGIQQFKQTDVVLDWYMELNVTQTYTAGTSALTASVYAPHNLVGPIKLSIQNQYASVDVESGIDLYIFGLIRPSRHSDHIDIMAANPEGDWTGSTATGYQAAANAQANLVTPGQWATGTATYNLFYRIPASQWFDVYYDRTFDGQLTGMPPHAAVVSPQYMAGTTRVITPSMKANQGNAATTDVGPVNIGAGTGTFTGNFNLTFRRQGVYAGSPLVMPPVYAWQYRWKTDRFGIAGGSQTKLQVPTDSGQLLAIYVRMFDPAANGGLGAAISLANVTSISLQYGSGLNRFIGTAMEWQRWWLQKRGLLLPPGVIAFDLAQDDRNLITNARTLNTLTTAGILVSVVFSGAQSATSYAVLGVESLVYVT